MKEKYYTPTIEEFHIGFEYEFTDSPTNTDWTKAVVRDGAQIDDITRKYKGESVYSLRAKYLDREDIESLGWKDIGSLWFEGFGLYQLRKWKDDLVFLYNTRHEAAEGKAEQIFAGVIKNKSELKKMMQQLGI